MKYYLTNQGGAIATLVRTCKKFRQFARHQNIVVTWAQPIDYTYGGSANSKYTFDKEKSCAANGILIDSKGVYVKIPKDINCSRVSICASTMHPTEDRLLTAKEILAHNYSVELKFILLEV